MVNLLQKERVIDTDDMLITHILIFWVYTKQSIHLSVYKRLLFSEQNIAGWNFITDILLLLSKSTENKVAPSRLKVSNSLYHIHLSSS